ncbi:MAG: DUF1800 domain-containing protein [Sphingorhabdus sp.]
MSIDAATAMNRFGLGAGPTQAAPGNPRNWLLDQLQGHDANPKALSGQPSTEELALVYRSFQKQAKAFRMAKKNGTAGDQMEQAVQQKKLARKGLQHSYISAANARLASALVTPTPFAERLTHFWSNHFAVSVDKPLIITFAGNYEFAAIRPRIMGKFSDLLISAVTHPAMLIYLDQAQSIGPDSVIGSRINARRKRQFGLNENLAREIMELHTLGVRAGFDQSDVTELARALTGWTVAGLGRGAFSKKLAERAGYGSTLFVDGLHQPGARTIMGKRYVADGQAQARAILQDIAVHPATAKHIATKLARHFVADNPPPSLVAKLEKNFLRTSGDLPSLYRTLVEAPEAWPDKWDAATAKFKSPWDWLVSSLRALNVTEIPGKGNVVGSLRQLGQPMWRPESPAGFADTSQNWAGGAALLRRYEIGSRIARLTAGRIDARKLAPAILPGVVGPNTIESIARAANPVQGLSLLLLSPEFLRR